MNMKNILKVLFVPIITQLLKLISKFHSQHPQPSSSGDNANSEVPDQAAARDDAVDPDVAAPAEAAGLVVVHRHQIHMDWTEIMIGFCLASAIDIAVASVQAHAQLSATFHLLSLAILFAFACFFVSEFIKSKFLVTAQVLQKLGVFFTVTAFFMAITIPFPLYHKFATWAIYTISIFAIFICRCW